MPAAIAVEVASHVAVAAAVATSAPLLSEFLHGRVLLCAYAHAHGMGIMTPLAMAICTRGRGHSFGLLWPWPWPWLCLWPHIPTRICPVDGIMLDYS